MLDHDLTLRLMSAEDPSAALVLLSLNRVYESLNVR